MAYQGFELWMKLDDVELSDQARTFSEDRDERAVEVELANGHTRKYIKYVAKNWNLTWDWLPNDDDYTADGRAGRDALKALASDGEEKEFVLYSVGGGTSTYTVFVVEYNEELIRRDYASGLSFWRVSMGLKEV